MENNSQIECNEELEKKIGLLNTEDENAEFLEGIKSIVLHAPRLSAAAIESRISKTVLPAIESRFLRIFTDNESLYLLGDEQFSCALIRKNLQVTFELVEMVQELLNHLNEHTQIALTDLESNLIYLPKYIQLFKGYRERSPNIYKDALRDDLSKVWEIMKHLFLSFLCLLETVQVQQDEISLLINVISSLCPVPLALYSLDRSIVNTWKFIAKLIHKYPDHLKSRLDIRIPLTPLTEFVIQAMDALMDLQDSETFLSELSRISFLLNILCKVILKIFRQQLDEVLSELLLWVARIISFRSKYKGLPEEALSALDSAIFDKLDGVMEALVLLDQSAAIKAQLPSLSVRIKALERHYSYGYLGLLDKILGAINKDDSDWSEALPQLINDLFAFVPSCRQDDERLYQSLITNISAAILIHDADFRSPGVLLKFVLQDDVFVALMALETYILAMSNVPPEEALRALTSLLGGVNYGFFTYRPEVELLKCLLQRLFLLLPDALKEKVIGEFPPDRCINVWRFLGFGGLPPTRLGAVLEPVLANVAESIKHFDDEGFNEDIAINIGECLGLISTAKGHPKVRPFSEMFWSKDLGPEILENNLMKYFLRKIGPLSATLPHLVLSKLGPLLKNQSYWVSALEIVFSTLIADRNMANRGANLLAEAMRRSEILKLLCLEGFERLNEAHKDVMNVLLDSFEPNLSGQIFLHLEKRGLDLPDHVGFTHKCLEWNNRSDIVPNAKRFKPDEKIRAVKPLGPAPSVSVDENDSCASEVIERLKGDVKCLIKACSAEKLSPKNVADLRIVMSKLSSLM